MAGVAKRYTDNQRVQTDAAGNAVATFKQVGPGQTLVGVVVCDAVGNLSAAVGGVPWASWGGAQPSGTIQVDSGLTLVVTGTNLPASSAVNLTFIGALYLGDDLGLSWPAAAPQSTVNAAAVLSGIAVANPGVDAVLVPVAAGVSRRLFMLGLTVVASAATATVIAASIIDTASSTGVLVCDGPQATATQFTAASIAVPLGGIALPAGKGLSVRVSTAGCQAVATALYS